MTHGAGKRKRKRKREQLRKRPPHDPAQSPSPKDATAQEKDNGKKEVPLMPNVPPSPPNPKYACQCQCNKTQWWKVALEVGAVIVGIAVWIVYYLQLDVMQQTLQSDQRAWIVAHTQDKAPDIIDGQPIQGMVHIANTGKTPAKQPIMHIAAVLLKNGTSPNFDADIPHIRGTTGVIWPNDPRDVNAMVFTQDGMPQPQIVTPEIRTKLLSGQYFIEIYGRIEYADVFKIHHKTRFCRWYFYAAGDYTAEPCTAYNGIDDDR